MSTLQGVSTSADVSPDAHGSKAIAVLVGNGAVFGVDELELVLESLCDLLADASFVPSLYASFDCDPTRPDLAQPLLTSICSCSR